MEIDVYVFKECTSLRRIVIPPKVKKIDDTAFDRCRGLTRVEFRDEIEELVSCETMRDWWKQGVHEKS